MKVRQKTIDVEEKPFLQRKLAEKYDEKERDVYAARRELVLL